MAKKSDEIQIQLKGKENALVMSLSPDAALTSFIGKRSMGSLPVDKAKTKTLFKLAETVMAEAHKSEYRRDAVFTELVGISILLKGKQKDFKLKKSATAPVMPAKLRLLSLEISGLMKW